VDRSLLSAEHPATPLPHANATACDVAHVAEIVE
jgi:hypothetical protein